MFIGDDMEIRETVKYINKKEQHKVLLIMPILLIFSSLFYATPIQLLEGLVKGVAWNQRLVSDSFVVMGIGPTLLNAGLLGLFSVFLLIKVNLKPNGLIIAAYYLMVGFGFIGKNMINVLPIFIGGYLYSHYKSMPFKGAIVVSMLGTTISPLLSSLVYVFDSIWIGIVVATLVGISFGFFLPVISSHVVIAHNGYSLYNMGFAAGLTSMIFYSVLKSNQIIFEGNMLLYEGLPIGVFIVFLIGFLMYIIIGWFENKNSFKGFGKVHDQPGKLVSDFTRIVGFPISLINMGVLGILTLIITFFSQNLNGAIICGIFSVVGFAAFGKHLKNVIPIMLGVLIASVILPNKVHISLLVMTMFLATSLAPIAGEFGIIAGVIAGILHMFFVWNISVLHGGINLYNNGLSAGILAMVLVPMIQFIKGEFE